MIQFWPFLKKKHSLLESGLLKGATDWHCHILPGVDDGIRTGEEAVRALACYEEWGISEVWLTPHIMEDMPNSTAALRDGFESFSQGWQCPPKLHLAAENMLDSLFLERFKAGDLLPLGPAADILLVETSYFNPPMEMDKLLEDIAEQGYKPLLAHPERYVYMEMHDYYRLLDAGVLMQLNLPSLCGSYGQEARQKALSLLRDGAYDRCGTDLHRIDAASSAFSRKVLDSETIKLLERII